MKKLVFFSVLFFTSFYVGAQVYVGGTLGLSVTENHTLYNFSPEIGYDINDKFTLGAMTSYYHDKYNDLFVINPYVRFLYYQTGIVSLAAEAGPAAAINNGKVGYEVNMKPLVVAIKTSDKLSLIGKVGYLGYRDKDYGGPSGISFNSQQVNLGINYYF